jgi:cation diffusion facilitator CzcD-associated flavoprotein CzcO
MSEAPVVVLIGTGAGGICGGVNLKARLGFSNFVIMEKSSRGFGVF